MKEPIQLVNTDLHFVRIDDLHVKVRFSIVENLAVDMPPSTTFIGRFIRGIFFGERRVVPWRSDPVPILKRTVREG